MNIKWNKRKTLIVVLWVLVMIISGLFFYAVEGTIFRNKFKTDLLEQADNVANHITSIVQNNYYADIGSLKILFSKLEASAFKLADYETIGEAKPFLDDISVSCGVSNLVVLDRDGNLLYGTEDEAAELGMNADKVRSMLDTREYETTANNLKGIVNYGDYLKNYYLTNGKMDAADDSYFWGVGNKWLIAFSNARPQAEVDVRNYFDWKNVLQRIVIGNAGHLVAIKMEDGSILSNPDASLNEKSLKLLGMSIKGYGDILSTEDLLNQFPKDDIIHEMTVNGTKYYGTRLAVDEAIILALLPKSEVNTSINGAVIISEALLSLITALVSIYAIIYMDDRYEKETGWNRLLANRLKIASVITLTVIFFFSAYLTSLVTYADMFRFSKTKVNNVVDILDKNEEAVQELKTWFDEEYLTRAKIIRSVLNHTEDERITKEYLQELCSIIEINYIYVIDGNGNIEVTNSRYDKLKIDEDSPFYPILQGKPELVFAADYDELMGETLAKVGVSMIEEHRDEDGILLVFANPTESQAIGKNLGYRSAFKQVSMINDSIVMVVDSETNEIRYMAKDINGELVPGDGSFNYTGLNISSLGISEGKLMDDFNGNMRVRGETYFASVKRSGNRFFLVMRPVEVTVMKTVLPVIAVVFAAFVYCMLLIFVSCRKHKIIKGLDTEKEIKTRLTSVIDSDSRVNTTLEDIVRKKKPFFEERWPRDCKKWKDKTAGEKFPVLIKLVLIVAVFDVLLHSWRVGSDSIWYYCFNGEWGTGINLYSLSACMMWICILVIAKMVLHKMLFLIAKVATPRGETVCNLLDNYMAYVLPIVGFFICLSNFGINTKALTLTGGAVGVIFGIGCQTIVADILSGFIMAIEGLVHNGDEVKLAADTKIVLGSGREEPVSIVLNVGIRTIMLKKVDGIMVVRNNEFRNYILLSRKAERSAFEEISAIIEEEVGSLEGEEGPFESAPKVPAEPKAQKAPKAPVSPMAAPKAPRKKVEK